MKRIHGLFFCLLAALVFVFSSCTDDENNASSDWSGNWTITQDIVWPQTKSLLKSQTGTITIDPSNKNKIIIAGGLLNSPANINASVVSEKASFTQKIDKNYSIKGTATLDSETKITFKFTIYTENSNSETYTRTAVKI